MFTTLIAFLIFIGTPALAVKDRAELERMSTKETATLFDHCEKISTKEWLKRYDKVEDRFIDEIEKLGNELEQVPQDHAFRQAAQIIFPQDLPQTYFMRGGFLVCIDSFDAIEKSKTAKENQAAREKLSDCLSSNYKVQAPPVLATYTECLRKLK